MVLYSSITVHKTHVSLSLRFYKVPQLLALNTRDEAKLRESPRWGRFVANGLLSFMKTQGGHPGRMERVSWVVYSPAFVKNGASEVNASPRLSVDL